MMISSPTTNPEALRLGLKLGDVDLGNYVRSLESHFNAENPRTMAFLRERDRFSRMQKEAASLNRHYPDPQTRPALFGMPIGVKDIFHVKGMPTKAGSRLPKRALRGAEATSVSQLKKAGALIMGKTVSTEFAYFAPGLTRNPHNLNHTPGGSSSGSAAAVAAGMVPLALGTQTIGSIIRPASFCGTVGFKASYERISRDGVIPLAPSLDHVGIFSPDVFTAQLAASVLCSDWRSSASADNRPTLAIPSGAYLAHADAEMLDHFMHVVEALRQAGFRVKTLDPMPNFDEIVSRHNLILSAEAAQVHSDWYRLYSQRYHARTAELIEDGKQIDAEKLRSAKREATYFSQSISTLMDLHGIDLWIAPSAPGPAPEGLESTGDPVMNLPWTQAGLPVLGLPTGTASNSLPLGTQFIANFNWDEELLSWGAEIEQVLKSAL